MSRADTLVRIRQSRPVIAPSMLKCDYADLAGELIRLEAAGLDLIHLDVMDGHFVPNLSYGALLIERLRPRTKMLFDAHLMISDPAKYLDEYVKAGCDAITVHIEALDDPTEVLERIHRADCVAGLAINPETSADRVLPYLRACDLLLLMTVRPGFGGQKFMPSVLPKMAQLRKAAPDLLISVDGGIGTATIAQAASAGAELFVAGSAVFDEANYRQAVESLRSVAQVGPAA